MEIGNISEIEFIFQKIYNEIEILIIEKSIILQKRLNNIQEYLLNFEELKFSEKLNYLEFINEAIKYKTESIKNKESLIKEKIEIIKLKLTKAFFSNREVFEHYIGHRESIVEHIEMGREYKKTFNQLFEHIKSLDHVAENLKVIKHEMNSKYLNNKDKENLKFFTEKFIGVYKNIKNVIFEVDSRENKIIVN